MDQNKNNKEGNDDGDTTRIAIEAFSDRITKLLQSCDDDLSNANEKLEEIYVQYKVDELQDPHIMSVIAGHINKTAELKIKSASEKVKIIDILHKMSTELMEIEVIKQQQAKVHTSHEDDVDNVYEEFRQDNDDPDLTQEEEDETGDYYDLVNNGNEDEEDDSKEEQDGKRKKDINIH